MQAGEASRRRRAGPTQKEAAGKVEERRARANSLQSSVESEPATIADALSSIALVSTLVFGFAIATFLSVMTEMHDWVDRPLICWFCVFVSLTCTLSGVATAYLSLQFYFLKRFSKLDVELFAVYMQNTSRERQFACGLTWMSLMLFFFSLCLIAIEVLPTAFAIACCVVFSVGGVLILIVWISVTGRTSVTSMREAKLKKEKEARDAHLAAQANALSSSQMKPGASGPGIPQGATAAHGKELIQSYWDTSFGGNAYGSQFEWVVPWSSISAYVLPLVEMESVILEVGCGNSHLATDLAQAYRHKCSIYAIDNAQVIIKQQQDRVKQAGLKQVRYECQDALKTSYPDGQFDLIIDKATFEAISTQNHNAYMQELSRILRLSGKYIVITGEASIALPNGFRSIDRKSLTRLDRAKGEPAYLHIFTRNANEPSQADDDDLWRAPFDDDDDDVQPAEGNQHSSYGQSIEPHAELPEGSQATPTTQELDQEHEFESKRVLLHNHV